MKDFFVSYNRKDKEWAEWIAWQLEGADYTTVIQAWDFRPGGNFVTDMQRAVAEADRTIAVLSQNYLDAIYTQPEWAVAFALDPIDANKTLLPVRVEECDLKGFLSQIVYIDLVGKPEAEARRLLLGGLRIGRAKSTVPPPFPGSSERPSRPTFPVAGNWGKQYLSPTEREAILQVQRTQKEQFDSQDIGAKSSDTLGVNKRNDDSTSVGQETSYSTKNVSSSSAFATARIVDHQPDQPLQLGNAYVLQAGIRSEIAEGFETASILLPSTEETIQFEIVVHAEDMAVQPTLMQSFIFNRSQETPLLEFELRPNEPGQKQIRVEFFYQRHWLAQINFEIEVVPAPESVPA